MTLVLADPASTALGWQAARWCMLGAAALLACALAYNNATRTRYPKGAVAAPAAVLVNTPGAPTRQSPLPTSSWPWPKWSSSTMWSPLSWNN